MRKSLVIIMAIILCLSGVLFGKKVKKDELYLQALVEQNPTKKMELLEEYYSTFGKKSKNLTSLLFINLVETSLKIKDFEKAVSYSELALNYPKLKEGEKLKVMLGQLYMELHHKKDYTAAQKKADDIISKAKSLKDISPEEIQREYISPATRMKIVAASAGSEGVESVRNALNAATEAFKTDRSEDSAKMVYYYAQKIYMDYSRTNEAFAAMETLCKEFMLSPEQIEVVALWYSDAGFNAKALEKMTLAYGIKKTSKRAFYIASFTIQNDVDTAVSYLAEAAVLKTDAFASEAEERLKKVIYEIKTKDLPEEEKEAALQKVLDEAKERISQ